MLFALPDPPDHLGADARFKISGIVRDATTSDTVAAATIRVLGTSLGTITNRNGTYLLTLMPGTYRLMFSSLGYGSDTITVSLTEDIVRDVTLVPSPIVLAEVIATAEDPAIAIIRKAIANKRRWMDRLHSYQFEAFTRQTLERDTSIAGISESFTRGYWQKGDTLREIVRQKRQTENIRSESNFASVGRILNFYEDRVRLAGYEFVGPAADDAFDYYDYRLLETRHTSGGDVYTIRVIPRHRAVPLFSGAVSIIEGAWALVGVKLEPNEAFVFPFLKEKAITYRQGFALYDDAYWMPVDINIDASFRVGIVGFSLPKIAFQHTSVLYSYQINTPIPDSIFQRSRLTVDSVALRRDTLLWSDVQVLPLSSREQTAYAILDSTKTLDVQLRQGSLGITIGGSASGIGAVLEYTDISFNRVEGFHLGARAESFKISPILSLQGGFAYGFSDKTAKYIAGATLYTSKKQALAFAAEVFRRTAHRPDQDYYSPLITTYGCLFAKNDYRDYFRSEGWKVSVHLVPTSLVKAELAYISSKDRSEPARTGYSFLYPSRAYRPNPSVAEGWLRSIQLKVRFGGESVPLDLLFRDELRMALEYADPAATGGDFSFFRYDLAGSVEFPTFGRSFLFTPALRLRLAAGASLRDLPAQRVFSLETGLSGLGPFGVLRAARVKEFRGTDYLALTAEHNFRTIPFLALGLPFLYSNNIELIVSAAVARTWNRGSLDLWTTDGWYAEVGIGLSRIFDLFRIDGTWRLMGCGRFVLTLATGTIL
jgi:hypothetical protein